MVRTRKQTQSANPMMWNAFERDIINDGPKYTLAEETGLELSSINVTLNYYDLTSPDFDIKTLLLYPYPNIPADFKLHFQNIDSIEITIGTDTAKIPGIRSYVNYYTEYKGSTNDTLLHGIYQEQADDASEKIFLFLNLLRQLVVYLGTNDIKNISTYAYFFFRIGSRIVRKSQLKDILSFCKNTMRLSDQSNNIKLNDIVETLSKIYTDSSTRTAIFEEKIKKFKRAAYQAPRQAQPSSSTASSNDSTITAYTMPKDPVIVVDCQKPLQRQAKRAAVQALAPRKSLAESALTTYRTHNSVLKGNKRTLKSEPYTYREVTFPSPKRLDEIRAETGQPLRSFEEDQFRRKLDEDLDNYFKLPARPTRFSPQVGNPAEMQEVQQQAQAAANMAVAQSRQVKEDQVAVRFQPPRQAAMQPVQSELHIKEICMRLFDNIECARFILENEPKLKGDNAPYINVKHLLGYITGHIGFSDIDGKMLGKFLKQAQDFLMKEVEQSNAPAIGNNVVMEDVILFTDQELGTLEESAKSIFSNMNTTGGKAKILGRYRKVYTVKKHQYIKLKGEMMLLSKAIKLEKKLEKEKKAPKTSRASRG